MFMNFYDWINAEYDSWGRLQPRNGYTVRKFAEFVGVSQQLMSYWLTRNRKPGANSIKLLFDKYGERMYQIDDLSLPSIGSPLDGLPPDIKDRLLPALNEINAIYGRSPIDADSKEARSIAVKVLNKYGIIIKSNSTPDD